jgi:hypothetical protein
MEIWKIISNWRSFIIFLGNEFIIVLWLINIVDQTIIKSLISFFIRKSEPCSLEFIFFCRWLSSVIKFSNTKNYNSSWLFDSTKLNLNFSVIINLKNWISNIIKILHP